MADTAGATITQLPRSEPDRLNVGEFWVLLLEILCDYRAEIHTGRIEETEKTIRQRLRSYDATTPVSYIGTQLYEVRLHPPGRIMAVFRTPLGPLIYRI